MWRAGVDLFGDSEIAESYRHGDRVGRLDLHRMMGSPDDPARSERYRRGSPVYRAERIEAPLLILHGRKDKRVVPLMTERMVEALEIEGKRHEVHWYDEEGHGWERRENRRDAYERILAFLKTHVLDEPPSRRPFSPSVWPTRSGLVLRDDADRAVGLEDRQPDLVDVARPWARTAARPPRRRPSPREAPCAGVPVPDEQPWLAFDRPAWRCDRRSGSALVEPEERQHRDRPAQTVVFSPTIEFWTASEIAGRRSARGSTSGRPRACRTAAARRPGTGRRSRSGGRPRAGWTRLGEGHLRSVDSGADAPLAWRARSSPPRRRRSARRRC